MNCNFFFRSNIDLISIFSSWFQLVFERGFWKCLMFEKIWWNIFLTACFFHNSRSFIVLITSKKDRREYKHGQLLKSYICRPTNLFFTKFSRLNFYIWGFETQQFGHWVLPYVIIIILRWVCYGQTLIEFTPLATVHCVIYVLHSQYCHT